MGVNNSSWVTAILDHIHFLNLLNLFFWRSGIRVFFFFGIFCKRNCMVTSRSRISGIPEMVVPWIPYAAVALFTFRGFYHHPWRIHGTRTRTYIYLREWLILMVFMWLDIQSSHGSVMSDGIKIHLFFLWCFKDGHSSQTLIKENKQTSKSKVSRSALVSNMFTHFHVLFSWQPGICWRWFFAIDFGINTFVFTKATHRNGVGTKRWETSSHTTRWAVLPVTIGVIPRIKWHPTYPW